jgi:hypothetical protein
MNKQQTEILQILKTLGEKGMNSFDWRRKYIQLPARIQELQAMGYLITTKTNKNRSVNYILFDNPQIKDEKKKPEKKFAYTMVKDSQGYVFAKKIEIKNNQLSLI